VPAALWSVSDRATPPTEGLPYRWRPSVGGFGGVRDPRRTSRRAGPARSSGRNTRWSIRHLIEWFPGDRLRPEPSAASNSRNPCGIGACFVLSWLMARNGRLSWTISSAGSLVRNTLPQSAPDPNLAQIRDRWPENNSDEWIDTHSSEVSDKKTCRKCQSL